MCEKEFLTKFSYQKLCSAECRQKQGYLKEKKRYEKSRSNSRKLAVCKTCGKNFEYHFRVGRGERHYCGRSCASKDHIKNGVFDNWRLRKQPLRGAYQKCINPSCENEVYLEPRFIERGLGKLCSFECEKNYFSQKYQKEKNPFFGKKHAEDSLIKQKQTLQSNHPGVKNAFALAKKRTKSKPQLAIFDYLKNQFQNLNFEIEKRVYENEKEYYADIVSFDAKLIIEFYGDYWHCNPKKYSENFFHQVKKKSATDIWSEDKKRLETISSFGYRILIIWEEEFKNDSWKDTLSKWVELNAG